MLVKVAEDFEIWTAIYPRIWKTLTEHILNARQVVALILCKPRQSMGRAFETTVAQLGPCLVPH